MSRLVKSSPRGLNITIAITIYGPTHLQPLMLWHCWKHIENTRHKLRADAELDFADCTVHIEYNILVHVVASG